MSAIANIVLADGQASPANHTFEVLTAQSGTDVSARWVEKSAGIYAGFLQLTSLVRRTNNKSTKVQVKVSIPSLATDGTNALIHTSIATVDVVLPDTMTTAERKDIRAYIANALDNAIIKASIEDLSPAY